MSRIDLHILWGLNVVAQLTLGGTLLLLCLRTRSKGLIVIVTTYIGIIVLGLISKPFFEQYIDQWMAGELNNWLTESMSVGTFIARFNALSRLIFTCMYLTGISLIYREWQLGKFGYPPPKHR